MLPYKQQPHPMENLRADMESVPMVGYVILSAAKDLTAVHANTKIFHCVHNDKPEFINEAYQYNE